MVYRISFSKILLEFVSTNLIVLVFSSIRNLSYEATWSLTVVINAILSLYLLNKIGTYKVYLDKDYVVIFNFKLGKVSMGNKIEYRQLKATYLREFTGRSIKQKKIRIFTADALVALLEPSFTGWHHDKLDQIALELENKGVSVERD